MPYLHWETNRNRRKASEAVKRTVRTNSNDFLDMAKHPMVSVIRPRINQPTLERVTEGTIPRRTYGKNALGKLLFLAASLYEAMDGYTDEKLIQKYLTATPTLHLRRTLDQSYYWTLKETSTRDKEQVIYQETSPMATSLHRACAKEDTNKDPSFNKCTENIKRVPRVVMVDQLWMWILDDSKCTTYPHQVYTLYYDAFFL